MATSRFTREGASVQIEIPALLRRACFALGAINLTLCLIAYLLRVWIYDRNGLGIPTDFVSFWAAGRLALDGMPAQAGIPGCFWMRLLLTKCKHFRFRPPLEAIYFLLLPSPLLYIVPTGLVD